MVRGCMVPGGCVVPGGGRVHGPRGCVHGPGEVHDPGGCLVETPRWLLLRAVRILLECILDAFLLVCANVKIFIIRLPSQMEKASKSESTPRITYRADAYYHSQMKLCKGNVFTPVCQSFCSRGLGVEGCLPQCMLGYTPSHTPPRQTPPWADTPWTYTPPGRHLPRQTPLVGYCTGRYASYWNAFLFLNNVWFCVWPTQENPIFLSGRRDSSSVRKCSSQLNTFLT